jgi:hypothetical protein
MTGELEFQCVGPGVVFTRRIDHQIHVVTRGGSVILMDLDHRLTFAYMMSRMAPGIIRSSPADSYLRAVYSALGVSLAQPALIAEM